ncbi:MAG: hypothetical protein O4861_21925, partial [Trichodesmium sp. St16_bin4-tuft]|nr:hypothetical protein [Trichodesmium sp. St16_bin4-tuft]
INLFNLLTQNSNDHSCIFLYYMREVRNVGLIAISYTISSFQVQKVKNKGVQEYMSRTNEKGRKERRHSSFFVGYL